MRSGLETPYTLIQPALTRFEADHLGAPCKYVRLPSNLASQNMHLDPDFAHVTYGDSGTRR
jgi:hypothetical protein